MAIWDFRGIFLPRKSVLEHFGEIPNCLPEYYNEFEKNSCIEINNYSVYYEYWKNNDIGCIEDEIKKLFNANDESWSDSMRVYGYQNSIRIDIWDKDLTDEYDSEEIELHIDIRNLDSSFLEKVLNVMDSFDCLLVTADTGKIIESNLESLLKVLFISRRYRQIHK